MDVDFRPVRVGNGLMMAGHATGDKVRRALTRARTRQSQRSGWSVGTCGKNVEEGRGAEEKNSNVPIKQDLLLEQSSALEAS